MTQRIPDSRQRRGDKCRPDRSRTPARAPTNRAPSPFPQDAPIALLASFGWSCSPLTLQTHEARRVTTPVVESLAVDANVVRLLGVRRVCHAPENAGRHERSATDVAPLFRCRFHSGTDPFRYEDVDLRAGAKGARTMPDKARQI